MTYKGWMELPATQWIQFNDFWLKTLDQDLAKGKLTKAQYDAVIKRRKELLAGYKDNTGQDADRVRTEPINVGGPTDNIVSRAGDTAEEIVNQIKNGIQGFAGQVGSTAMIAIGAVLLILLIRR